MNADGKVVAKIAELGLLLLQDRTLRNAVELLIDGPIRGSWWSHPEAHRVYATLEKVEASRDVMVTKLVGGKVTYVHRKLWPAVLAVATASEAWQTRGLSPEARRLFSGLDRNPSVDATGVAVKEVEKRLLAHGEEIHTAAGRHATRLESWRSWAASVGCRPLGSADEAKRVLEQAVERIGGSPALLLPWHSTRKGGR